MLLQGIYSEHVDASCDSACIRTAECIPVHRRVQTSYSRRRYVCPCSDGGCKGVASNHRLANKAPFFSFHWIGGTRGWPGRRLHCMPTQCTVFGATLMHSHAMHLHMHQCIHTHIHAAVCAK